MCVFVCACGCVQVCVHNTDSKLASALGPIHNSVISFLEIIKFCMLTS